MPSSSTPTFSQRLARRNALWWAVPGGWRNPATWRRPLHRVLDCRRLRSRDWPAERWRCCRLWQRCLLNKWNSREFAVAHGVAVPELYWSGRRVADAPLESLTRPYVIRPAWGAGCHKSHMIVDGRDLNYLTDVTPESLRATLRRENGPIARYPLLFEEFLTNLEGQYDRALEYNIYVFGDRVAVVRQLLRVGMISSVADYDEHWNPLRDDTGQIVKLQDYRPVLERRPRPERLEEMVAVARRLGTAIGTFIRVDLYDTPRGVVFGEFSSVPSLGKGFSPWTDRYLGDLWAETFPNES